MLRPSLRNQLAALTSSLATYGFRKTSRLDVKVRNHIRLTPSRGQLSHQLVGLMVKSAMLILPLFFIATCICVPMPLIPLLFFIKKSFFLLKHAIFP